MKKVYVILAMLISLTTAINLVSADADDFGSCGMFSMMSGTYGLGMGLFGWLFSILIIVALVLLIIWLVKQIQKSK